MKQEYQTLHIYLLNKYSKEKADRIKKGLLNPARYPWIINELKLIQKDLELHRDQYERVYFLKLYYIIEDELINGLLICQDSKCEPFKFVNFKRD